MGEFCSFLRQEGGENLESHILLIPIAVGAPLNHTNLVIQALDEAQLHLVARRAIRCDAVPVPFDQSGKLLKGPESLPLELLLPPGEELPRPALAAIRPELPEFLLEQVGRSQALVGPEQFPERAAAGQREIGAVGEERVALALDKGSVLRGHPCVLGPADLLHRVGQMTQDVELVEQNLRLRGLGLHRVAKRLPHVHHRQPNPVGLLRPQVEKEPVQIGCGSARTADPDGTPALQVADDDPIRVALPDRQFIHADDLRRWLRRLG